MVELPKSIIPGIMAKAKKPIIHIAVNTTGVRSPGEGKKEEFSEMIKKHLELLDLLVGFQQKYESRVLTINLSDIEPELLVQLREFFRNLLEDERIHKNQVRVFIIGQWFEMDLELTELFKEIMEKTKQYDNMFLNFCIKYDGQEEILGAIRLMVRKIIAGKMKEEDMTTNMIKENIYSSYFPPPNLIIETAPAYSGLLQWDAKGTIVYYTKKNWLSFEKKDWDDAIEFYEKTSSKE